MVIGKVLNPKMASDIAVSKEVSELAKGMLALVNNQAQCLTRAEVLNLFENLNRIFSGKAEELVKLEKNTESLIKKLDKAETYVELRDIHADLNAIQRKFFTMLPSVPDLQRTCTDYRDKISKKVVSLVIRDLISQNNYLPDESFAYIALGSDGRMEQTLFTDQDNLLVYEDSAGRYKEFYYQKFAELLVERLAFCGFKKCTGDIMPSNPHWRGSVTRLLERIDYLSRFTDPDFGKNLVNLIVLTDLRFIYGDEELAKTFIDLVFKKIFENHIVLNEIAKSAGSLAVAKGFMNTLKLEKKGPHKNMINIKLHGWAPLILALRAFAIKNKVEATSTLGRVDGLIKMGAFSEDEGQKFRRAFFFLTRMKVFGQLMYLDGKYDSDVYINPEDLSKEETEELIESLDHIEKLQKLLIESMSLRM